MFSSDWKTSCKFGSCFPVTGKSPVNSIHAFPVTGKPPEKSIHAFQSLENLLKIQFMPL
jgi:hypothetical protein